jgi:hypothetical protein
MAYQSGTGRFAAYGVVNKIIIIMKVPHLRASPRHGGGLFLPET